MPNPASPEILTINSVTVVRPGPDFSNLYENLLDSLGLMPQLVETLSSPLLVVDMQNVRFIGSAFLGRMVSLHKAISKQESGRFALCGMNSFCNAAFSVSKLDSMLEVFATVDDAVAALSGVTG